MFRKNKIIILLPVLAAAYASGTAAASPSSAVISTFPAVTSSAAPASYGFRPGLSITVSNGVVVDAAIVS